MSDRIRPVVTAQQNAYNLRTARGNVARRLGITDTAALDYDARVAYLRALAAEILRYPQSFTEETLATARRVSAADYKPIDAATPFADFADAFIEEAKETLPAVGNKLLLALVVVAAVYFGVKAWRSSPAPVAA